MEEWNKRRERREMERQVDEQADRKTDRGEITSRSGHWALFNTPNYIIISLLN